MNIKQRGFCDGLGWIIGVYAPFRSEGGPIMHTMFSLQKGSDRSALYGAQFDVRPDTVGLFSGWQDKHGVDIYSGDILTCLNEDRHLIHVRVDHGMHQRTMASGAEVEISGFCFRRPNGQATFPIVRNYRGVHDCSILEVVGNIHENIELNKLFTDA